MEERMLGTGCRLTRTFNQSATENWIEHIQRLREKGYDDQYVNADYHWGMVNKQVRTFVHNTEGDVDVIQCPDDRAFLKELEKQRDFMRRIGDVTDYEIKMVEKMITDVKGDMR